MSLTTRAIGAPLDRLDGPQKVTGTAPYAFEYPVAGATYAFPIQSTIAKGRVVSIDARAARALPGVVCVLSHENAPRLPGLHDAELAVLQSDAVAYHGQFVGVVVAETPEIARHAASLVAVRYEEQPYDVELRADRGGLYKPERINAGFETDTSSGDVEAALASAPIALDLTYTTPAYHNNPLEPHATIAVWSDDGESVTLYDANQGVYGIRDTVAATFGLPPERVRVIAPYVGGGFGSKAFAHPPVMLALLAARAAGRPVKLALTRQQMFAVVGYRTPTIQRLRLGAERDGRLTAIAHDVVEQTAAIKEFAEQTAVATRMMYAAPNRRTTHRLARLDVPVPTIMRAPGECPGMFALESALDELAVVAGLDPIELRIRNEPESDPGTGRPFSSRGLVACLREGAERFGCGRLDLPNAAQLIVRSRAGGRCGTLYGPHRRLRHRDRRADGAHSDRRRCARRADGACAPGAWRQRAPTRAHRRWLDGYRLLGDGDRGGGWQLARTIARRARRRRAARGTRSAR